MKSLLVLGLAVFIVYVPTLFFPFVYDDTYTILRNQALNHVTPIGRFFTDPSTAADPKSGIGQDVYRPLPTLSFAVSSALGGLKPAGFRGVSLILHLLNGCLLWFLLQRRIAPLPALAGALLFVGHPVQVESVVWITQRSVLMCGLGSLAALAAWDLAKENPRWYPLSGLALAFALLSKETAVVIPILFIAAALFEGRPRDKALLAHLLATCLMALGYLLLRRAILGHWSQDIQYAATAKDSILEGLTALGHYAQTLLWPLSLNVSYRSPRVSPFQTVDFWMGFVILFFLVGMAVIGWRRRSLIFWGSLLCLAFWLPHSGVLPLVTYAADRFLYLPMIGVAVLFSSLMNRSPFPARVGLWLVLAIFCLQAQRRTQDWKSEKALWAASLRVDPNNFFALGCYARTLEREGDDEAASLYYERALASQPTVTFAEGVLRSLERLKARRYSRIRPPHER